MTTVESILEHNGPMLASEIKEILMSTLNITDVAARQQISRAKGKVERLKSFSFPKNEYFLFLKNHYKTELFYSNLTEALIKSRSATGNTIAAFQCLSGKICEEKFKVIAGAKSGTKRKTLDSISKELKSVDLIQEIGYEDKKISLSSQLSKQNELSDEIVGVIDEVLFANLQEWLKKNSLVSYNKIEHYGEFSDYYWDITAPTYLRPFITKTSDYVKPGFLVVDYFPQTNVSAKAVEYFVSKVSSVAAKRNIRPFLPIFIALSYTQDAFNKLKENNIFATTIANLLGKENEKLLYSIIDTLRDMNKKILKDDSIESINKILKEVVKLDGKFNNLKGSLFELLTANAMFKIHGGYVEINKKFYEKNLTLAEVDVMCVVGNSEILIIECKAYKNLIDEKFIEEWNNKISKTYNWLRKQNENNDKKITFEYWTTSDFTEEAQKLLAEKSSITKKYTINWKNRIEILNFFRAHNLSEQCKILNEYYSV
ncbi:MAG: NERD domain-containing protein [Treponema sp.]|uniref:hypothetical protein n=1 Tax=Treponema sp. TaxID=166 RepID=UPI0025E8F526|nr:hypothetical protein [Treponema sp.]MBR0496826.1 NERD domain-containing protein [Treponema sp.]